MLSTTARRTLHRAARGAAGGAALMALMLTGACRSASEIGQVLGGVLGGQGQSGQLQGTIAGVDTRNRQIGIQQSNGQTVGIGYDENTAVIFQNRRYEVTSLEQGDQVVAHVVDQGNGNYYTDTVQVTASVQNTNGGTTTAGGSVQSLSGVVRQIDRTNGLFALDMQGTVVTVSLPYNARSTDVTRFQQLRVGDQIRIAGVFLNNTRVELRGFY